MYSAAKPVRGSRGAAGSLDGRGSSGPEVRRHLGRRPGSHPGRGRSRRPNAPCGRRRRRRGLGDGQDDRRSRAAGRRRRRQPGGREMDMLLTAGERISMALLSMAVEDLGEPAVTFTGSQAGIVTDTEHGKAKIIEVRGDRIREALADGQGRDRRRASRACRPHATSPRWAGADPTRRRSRWPPRSAPTSARSTPTSKACTPPIRASCPTRASSPGSRSTRCSRWRPPAGGCSRCARSSSRATTGVQRARAVELHLGAGNLGHRGGRGDDAIEAMEQAIISGVTHDTSEAKVTIEQVPDRPGDRGHDLP